MTSHSLTDLYRELDAERRRDIEAGFASSELHTALAALGADAPSVELILSAYSGTYGGASNVHMDSRYYAEPTTMFREASGLRGANLVKGNTPYPIFLPYVVKALIRAYRFYSGPERLRRLGADLSEGGGDRDSDNHGEWGLVPSSLGLVVVMVLQANGMGFGGEEMETFNDFKRLNPTGFIVDWMYGGNTLLFYRDHRQEFPDGKRVIDGLADVASGLPPYEEQVMLSSMDSEEDATGYSQRSAYNTVYEELRLKLAEALKAGSKRLLATYLQTLLAYPDGCTRGETVFDPRSGDVIVQVPPLSEERLYPKEKALIDMVAAERMEGRRVLVYATHTGTRDITERMDDMLTRHGFRVAVMKADAVAPERREAWVADRVKQGIDVMICHPRLVQTGLDLIDFPTLIWYETDYSVYVMRQASRRSWRIGQTRPVKVVFMSYRNTLQADALKLVAKKLQSSLAVEGELPEDGLAAYGDDGDDLMMALARKIVSGDEEEDETVEAVFAQARDAEAASEEFLVDDGWKVVEVEPEAAPVNGNGHHANGNGHETIGIGPTVELALGNGHHANGNGHAPAPVNGNGHHDEAPEPQQSLFSWAEFMAEEPMKPKGRGRKPQPAATSLFEWALEMEQEREEEPVGAGR